MHLTLCKQVTTIPWESASSLILESWTIQGALTHFLDFFADLDFGDFAFFGDFLGDFAGVDFLDGDFLGDFAGIDFLDGDFLDGDFLDGDFLDGDFEDFLDLAGDFLE